jgi:hypothetical protein
LEAGVRELRRACELNEIPFEVLTADPADRGAWANAARGAIDRLLGVG